MVPDGCGVAKAPMNHTGARIEVGQIPAELAQHRDMINPGADAQGFQALDPAVGDFARDGFSRLKLTQQKAVQADEEFLTGDTPPSGGVACIQKALEPKSQWTAKEARRHMLSSLRPGHGRIAQGLQIRLRIDERSVDVTMPQHVGDGFDG